MLTGEVTDLRFALKCSGQGVEGARWVPTAVLNLGDVEVALFSPVLSAWRFL